MPAALFPYYLMADASADSENISTARATQIVTAKSGREQRRQLWTQKRRTFRFRWRMQENSLVKLDTIYAFYDQTAQGALVSFDAFDFEPNRVWKGEIVGTGTGAQTVFDLPCRNGSGFTIYHAGVSQPGGNYSVTPLGGTNGRDKLTYSAGTPGNGVAITADFKGQLWVKVRFLEDKLDYSTFSAILFDMGVALIEVKGE